eukprot:3586958-Prymnesium_polylepis.1
MRLSALNMLWRDALPYILAERDELQIAWAEGPDAWRALCAEEDALLDAEYERTEFGEYNGWDDVDTPDPSAALARPTGTVCGRTGVGAARFLHVRC